MGTASSLKGNHEFPQGELSGTTTLKVCMSKGERQREHVITCAHDREIYPSQGGGISILMWKGEEIFAE